jgi:hypothetical protein
VTERQGKDKKDASAKSKSMTTGKPTLAGRVGQVVNAAAEAAGATALGKVAEAYGKTEAASDEQLSATDKGYFDAMGKIAEKAESREERDAVREDLNNARSSSHESAKERSKQRTTVFGQIATAIVIVVGGTAVALKLIKR